MSDAFLASPLANHNVNVDKAPAADKSQVAPVAVYYQPLPPGSFPNFTISMLANAVPSARTAQSTSRPPPMDPAKRQVLLSQYTSVGMRSLSNNLELPKKPNPNEEGIVYHSPDEPGLNYDLFFSTTHDFLDVDGTVALYPSFVNLPIHLRPSRTRYDATKRNPDSEQYRIRCICCRAQFGGPNAKAMWERHVKDHWPKQGMYMRHRLPTVY